MKYKLYRSFGNLDKDVRRHELVAVEYGMNLEAVTNALIRAVADDPPLLRRSRSRGSAVFGGTTMR